MRKTGLQVEADIFGFIKGSPLATAVNGGVYRDGMRPVGSKKEDIVVSFMTGLAGQVETGTVTVHVFVPDIDSGKGVLVKDMARLRTLEALADSVISSSKGGEYKMSLGNTIQSFKAEGADQHFVDVKIKFKRASI